MSFEIRGHSRSRIYKLAHAQAVYIGRRKESAFKRDNCTTAWCYAEVAATVDMTALVDMKEDRM